MNDKEERDNVNGLIPFMEVEKKIVEVRGQQVLLDRDVAALYGVETKRINEAVRNNPRKFSRNGYMLELSAEESAVLRSKYSTLEQNVGKGHHSKYNYKAFTEKGLYMLATVLKSPRAEDATFAIIETFAKVRSLKQELVELHQETDKEKQNARMQHFGDILSDIVMPDMQTSETESTLEINFFIGKIRHTVKRVRKGKKSLEEK